MLDTFFLQIFDMTKVAGITILAVLLVRLCLKRAPKVFSYALWAVVLFRLLCPMSIEAPVSLIPQTEPTIESYDLLNEPITPIAAMDAAGQAVGDALNGGIGIQHVRTADVEENGAVRVISTDGRNVWMLFCKYAWMVGIAVMLLYSGVLYVKLRRRLLASVKLRGSIYLTDHIDSPFVMGLFRPKIYLPSSLPEQERGYILLHEQHHIRRGDHIIKLLSFAALCLHWFNPLVWVAFLLSGRDMEMSCDEAVLRKLGGDIRADYSASLIRLATGRRIIAGTPLAFGESSTEGRIRNIAKWKKPTVWVMVIAVIACAVATVCLITNPVNRDTLLWGAEYRITEILYRTEESGVHADNDLPSVCITADDCLWERNGDGEWEFVGQMEPYALTKKELEDSTASADGWRRYNSGEITDSYILRTGDDAQHFYLALRTGKGDTLLGYGTEEGASDDIALFWLCRLESTLKSTGQAGMFLERSLASTVGGDADSFYSWTNADRPGYILIGFKSDNSAYSDGWLVPSAEKTDMGFAVFCHNKDESGYRLLQCHVYKNAALAENGIYLCPDPAALDPEGERKPEMTYDVILLNNPEITRAERVWEYTDGSTQTWSEGYLTGQDVLLIPWEYNEAGCRVWQYFYDEYDELIAGFPIEKSAAMVPTTANVSGAFDSYVYVPMDGANYRYELMEDASDSLTKDKLIHTFTETADPNDIEWRVYSTNEYSDRSIVLVEAGEDDIHPYRYSPSKAVDSDQLSDAKASGMITMEDGYATFGQELWHFFCEKTQAGESASVKLAHYRTLKNGNYSQTYYEVYKEDYPALFTFDLTYDRGTYTLSWEEYGTPYVRTYKYLMKYEDTLPSEPPQNITRYVLTNDDTVSWEGLVRGLASSQLGDAIDHYSIYTEKE